MTALSEYVDLENYFYANYALKLHQNSRIILDSFTSSLFLKLFQHNSRIPSYLCGSSLLHCLWPKTRMYNKAKQKAGKQQQENKEIKQNQLVHIHLITIYMNNNVHACMYAAMWLLSLLGQLFVWMLLHDSGSYAILCCIVYVLK